MEKFISVVVPAYNEEKYLTPCLESLAGQDYPRDKFEIIVELSGSTDATEAIARKFAKKITNTGGKNGVSAARDNGARAAEGEIIAQTDADTVVSKNWLSTINKNFEDDSVVGLTGRVEFLEANWVFKTSAKYFYPIFVKTLFSLGKSIFSGMNFAIKKDTFEAIGGFNKNLVSAEDLDLGVRASKLGKVKFCDDMIVYTSARRVDKSPTKFLAHNVVNGFSFLFLKKARSFENIR
ncbi:MAG TPA: glycosyltransferase [Candidatus Saccharimonadales bacterium]|nr:glycosyltransferase [Candidatus Saccharimonadales bacterium]